MNYVRHLNGFFAIAKNDDRLTSLHISLYIALFQSWNFNRFRNPFPIHRTLVMQLSKIGSKNTYHKCVRDLHNAGYIFYHTQVSKFQPIKISIVRLDHNDEKSAALQLNFFQPQIDSDHSTEDDTGTVPDLIDSSTETDTGTVPDLGHSINQTNNKTVNSVSETPTKIFNKNEKLSQAINGMAAGRPSRTEVEIFFLANKYPSAEAKKFFFYNQGKGWMLTDKFPIRDWQAIAHKWMLNDVGKVKSPLPPSHEFKSDKNYSEPL